MAREVVLGLYFAFGNKLVRSLSACSAHVIGANLHAGKVAKLDKPDSRRSKTEALTTGTPRGTTGAYRHLQAPRQGPRPVNWPELPRRKTAIRSP